jgi:hypothetical protein
VFDSVTVDEDDLLPGDGYDDFLKPFRTIEDVHVIAAVVGWAIGVARASSRNPEWIEEAAALLVLLRAIGDESPTSPEAHVVVAGVMAAVRRLLDRHPWANEDAATRSHWERDRPLLDVAERVRTARIAAAWRTLTPGST